MSTLAPAAHSVSSSRSDRAEPRAGTLEPGQKLLILTSEFAPFHGGIGTYARELALAGAAAGVNVTVAAPDYGSGRQAADGDLPFEIYRYAGGVPDARGLPKRITVARHLAASTRYDIVHAVDWPFFVPMQLASWGRQARRIATFHGTELSYLRAAHRSGPLALLRFWNGDVRHIANSRFTCDLLLERFPKAKRGHPQAIPLGVSAHWLRDQPDRTAARKALRHDELSFIIVSLGRMVERKGHQYVAEALALLPTELAQRITWYVIGSPQEEAYVARLRATVETSHATVRFMGALPDEETRTILAASDVFCLPGFCDQAGRIEGFGLVYLEAAAFGLPSIATRIGGIPDAIDDEVTGFLLEPRRPDQVADVLKRLLESPELRKKMSDAARQKAHGSTWDHVFGQTYSAALS